MLYGMKIDIAKVHDTIDWNFLEKAITNFGFHEKMVRWIMVCISNARFTINLNGERKGYFSSGRGLRQGDPMSSCLFTLVMEVTLLMAKNVQQNANFKFHMGCKELKLSHLCFFDDMLVISHGEVESVRIIRDTMRELSDISILIPNMDKSTVFFGNASEGEKDKILNILLLLLEGCL
ncbi:RNA-directed DNA polymerase, eukaryota, reverse transcriptase zinc-binding domain protein [Tanacetum coccineum]